MKDTIANVKSPALIGLLLTLPFMILELVNRRNFHEGFPLPLFAILWLLPTVFIIILMPIVRNIRARNNLLLNPVNILIRVVFLILIATFWMGIVMDQMLCFLGVSNCD